MNDNTNNSTSPRPQGQGEERRRRPIDEMLARDVEELISRDGDGEYEWRDTKSALVEACHLAWLTGRITDATGRKLGFGRIVALACRRLGLGALRAAHGAGRARPVQAQRAAAPPLTHAHPAPSGAGEDEYFA